MPPCGKSPRSPGFPICQRGQGRTLPGKGETSQVTVSVAKSLAHGRAAQMTASVMTNTSECAVPLNTLNSCFQGTEPLRPPPLARCAPSGLCCPFSHPRPQMRISWGRGPWVRPGNKRRGSRFMSTYCVPGTVHSLCHCERYDSPFHGEQTEPWAGTSLYPSSVQLFSLRLRPQLSQHPEGRESGAEQLSGKGC